MVDRKRLGRLLRSKLRDAGRQFERTRRAYRDGEETVLSGGRAEKVSDSIPRSPSGKPRIVCRRYAERRAVELDDADRPTCFEMNHPDCEGCVEDLHGGSIETW